MKTSRPNTLLASAAALTMLAALSSTPARADVLSPIIGSYSGHFNNYEDFYSPLTGAIVTSGAGGVGQQNFGLDLLGSVVSSSGGVYGGPGTGDYLIGVFGGITVDSVYNATTGTAAAGFGPGTISFANGGTFHIYEVPQADFLNTAAFNAFMNSTGASGFIGGACGGQTLAQAAAGTGSCYSGLTTLAGVTDVLDFSLVTSFNSFVDGLGATIAVGPQDLEASLSDALVGSASTWGDVIGGTDAAQFAHLGETTPIGTLADISLTEDFCPESSTCTAIYAGAPDLNWTAASSDPVNGFAAVPEPGTFGLFGTALLSLGAGLRRRKRT